MILGYPSINFRNLVLYDFYQVIPLEKMQIVDMFANASSCKEHFYQKILLIHNLQGYIPFDVPM